MNKSSNMPNEPGSGDPSPELVPVVEPGATALMFPQPAEASGDELALDGLLSEALFGEVIDISDLIPRVLSPEPVMSGGLALDSGPADPGLADGGDGLAAGSQAVALTILYDDDMLASDGTIL